MYEPEERPNRLSRFVLPIGVAAALIVIVVAAVLLLDLGGGGDDDGGEAVVTQPTAEPSPTPPGSNPQELALGQFVRTTLNVEYAGDCASATPNQPPAADTTPGATGATGAPPAQPPGERLCSLEQGEREGVRAYTLGAPLSEPSRWAFVEQVNGVWQVVYAPEINAETAAVPGTPWPLKPGAAVIVTGAAPCLNVREGPALSQAAVDCIADGTRIVVAAGPAEADGYQWWQVEGRAGWVVAAYLRYEDAAQ